MYSGFKFLFPFFGNYTAKIPQKPYNLAHTPLRVQPWLFFAAEIETCGAT
jgi:hypothetical protein